MRSSKGGHRIVVLDVEYRWRAKGNDGYILIVIWPMNNVGPQILGTLRYHDTLFEHGDSRFSAGDQIIVTNRLIRRIIEYAIAEHHYDSKVKGKELNLRALDEVIKLSDAVRASTKQKMKENGQPSRFSNS
jgi:hypothetical protein